MPPTATDPRGRRLPAGPAGPPGGRPVPRRVRPQGDRAGRARDARPHGPAGHVLRRPAAGRRPHHRLAAHDDPDRGADRDPGRAGRRGPLGVLQHLLLAGPRRRGRRRRARRDRRRAPGGTGLRLEGRDPRGVLVVHRAGAAVARRRWPEPDPRRRRRRHPPRPQGHRVRGGGGGAGDRRDRLRGVGRGARTAAPHDGGGPEAVDPGRRGHPGRLRGDHDRRPPPLPDARGRQAALPGDQRQRLGDEVEVRQQVRLPALADRRHQAGDRRDDRREAGRRVRLRRRRQGLRRVAAGPGRAGRSSPRSTRSAPCRRRWTATRSTRSSG